MAALVLVLGAGASADIEGDMDAVGDQAVLPYTSPQMRVTVDVLANDTASSGIDQNTLTILQHLVTGGTAEVVDLGDNNVRRAPVNGGFDRQIEVRVAPGSTADVVVPYTACDNVGSCDNAVLRVFVDTSSCTVIGEAPTVLIGSGGDDVICLTGTASGSIILALDGDDTIIGSAGVELIVAGTGDDVIYSREGADFILAGEGFDDCNSTGLDVLSIACEA